MSLPGLMRSGFGLVLLAIASIAFAATQPFDKAKFDAALAQGKPLIVGFAADWCPTCKEQKPVVDALLNEAKRKDLTVFVADFDKEEALKRQLKVTMQSTFIVLKGGKEVARSTGQTKKAELAAVFDKAM